MQVFQTRDNAKRSSKIQNYPEQFHDWMIPDECMHPKTAAGTQTASKYQIICEVQIYVKIKCELIIYSDSNYTLYSKCAT